MVSDASHGNSDAPRIRRLAPEEWSAAARELLSVDVPGLAPLAESRWMTTMAHNPKLLRRFGPLATHLLLKGLLPDRSRELIILRTAWLCQAPYEWSEHVLLAKQTGITTEQICKVINGPDDPAWTDHEAALLRAVDELHADSVVSDQTWMELSMSFDEPTLIELLMLVGMYHLVAWTQTSMRLELEPGRNGLMDR